MTRARNKMELTLKDLAGMIGGEVDGDGSVLVSGVSGIKEAGPGHITFLANPKYAKEIKDTKASAIIAAPGVQIEGLPVIRAANPYFAFAKAVSAFAPRKKVPGRVFDGAHVSPDAVLGEGVTVYPNAYISEGATVGEGTVVYPGVFIGEGSKVGRDCILYPNVVVREGVTIGDRVIIHGGTVVGSDGFGYATDAGKHYKIPQIGGVVIEDDVELGSNVSVDRGALGDTIIRRGTKIDNLVQIAHNVVIGNDSIICGQSGISGSTEVGHHVVLAGQVGLVGHIKVGDGAQVGAQSGVMNDLAGGQPYTGSPAMPHREFLKMTAVMPKLPEIRKKIMEIAKKIEQLENK